MAGSFLLLSLNDEDSKKLTTILSNDTSRKILDYLGEHKDATESSLSKVLDIPISTVHYNLAQLTKAKLVKADKFHYSEKGKEVMHYQLANKYVIIAPKESKGLRQKLRSILPTITTIGIISLIIQWFSRPIQLGSEPFLAATREVADEAALPQMAKSFGEPIGTEPNLALCFFVAAIGALLIFFFWQFINSKISTSK